MVLGFAFGRGSALFCVLRAWKVILPSGLWNERVAKLAFDPGLLHRSQLHSEFRVGVSQG